MKKNKYLLFYLLINLFINILNADELNKNDQFLIDKGLFTKQSLKQIKLNKSMELLNLYRDILRPYYKNFKKVKFDTYIQTHVKDIGFHKSKKDEVKILWSYSGYVDIFFNEPKDGSEIIKSILKNGLEVELKLNKSVMRIIPKGNKFYMQSWQLNDLTILMLNDKKNNKNNMKTIIETFGNNYVKQENSKYIIINYKKAHIKYIDYALSILEEIKDINQVY
jgi:hypothetical protein